MLQRVVEGAEKIGLGPVDAPTESIERHVMQLHHARHDTGEIVLSISLMIAWILSASRCFCQSSARLHSRLHAWNLTLSLFGRCVVQGVAASSV